MEGQVQIKVSSNTYGGIDTTAGQSGSALFMNDNDYYYHISGIQITADYKNNYNKAVLINTEIFLIYSNKVNSNLNTKIEFKF
jgi:V8-like Glu-specific endopeptidase